MLAPLAAVIILFTQIPQAEIDGFTWAKVAATAFGLVVVVILLNGLNLAIFVTAKQGTWRNRFPSIFVDIARVLIIAVSLAVLFGWIWGADVGGLFTALGIGSIVIGLALQNAVGSVLSGLFLLFEQPFEIRRVHGDLGGQGSRGRHELAGDAPRHGQRHPGHPELRARGRIVPQPDACLVAVRGIRHLPVRDRRSAAAGDRGDGRGGVRTARAAPRRGAVGGAARQGEVRDQHPADEPGTQYGTLALFRTRLWYASRRAGLHLDRDLTDKYTTPERVREHLLRLAPRFEITAEEAEAMVEQVRLERYGEGEIVQRVGRIPDGIRVIIEGIVELQVPAARGAIVPILRLQRDDLLGLTALTRQPMGSEAVALEDLAVLYIPVASSTRS